MHEEGCRRHTEYIYLTEGHGNVKETEHEEHSVFSCMSGYWLKIIRTECVCVCACA